MDPTKDTFRWAVISLAFVQQSKDIISTLYALRCLDLYTIMDDEETALDLFHAALQAGTTMGIHRLRAECMVGIGDIMSRRGDSIHARELWEVAHPLFVRSSRMKDAAAVKKQLENLCHMQEGEENLGTIQEGSAGQSDVSAAADSGMEKLLTLSAPKSFPPPEVKTTGTSMDGNKKLLVL
jgi:hypothetical protein